nr:hypothetical protein [candidate division KSB1 bacterium]NIR69673.1 hypothetical protein [candidate division KSB1 bacterium]NIS22592.1 hypothetical protein [candidate division KSB1 bacterium]NIT69452.1 hypothetical protein [candidate division KSB1 bacterium]NIU23107.1 hypothetical protein [candidate division KSB1 bacterium]
MNLKKQIVLAIIFLTAVSLVGLIALQTYLLKNAVEQKEQAFRQNINAALNTVVRNLETREALSEVINL